MEQKIDFKWNHFGLWDIAKDRAESLRSLLRTIWQGYGFLTEKCVQLKNDQKWAQRIWHTDIMRLVYSSNSAAWKNTKYHSGRNVKSNCWILLWSNLSSAYTTSHCRFGGGEATSQSVHSYQPDALNRRYSAWRGSFSPKNLQSLTLLRYFYWFFFFLLIRPKLDDAVKLHLLKTQDLICILLVQGCWCSFVQWNKKTTAFPKKNVHHIIAVQTLVVLPTVDSSVKGSFVILVCVQILAGFSSTNI